MIKNEYSDYYYRRSRTEKIRIMGCIIVVLALILIPYIIFGVKTNFINIFTEILSSIVGMLVVFLCWEIAKNRRDEEAHDKHLSDLIMRLMQHDNGMIRELYSNYSADRVLKNCLAFYNDKLADSFLRYFKANMASFRTSLNYRVEIGPKEIIEGRPVYNQTQIVSYTRHFKVMNIKEKYSFQCFFAMKPQLLEKRMNQSIWFFREIITDSQLIKQLSEKINDKEEVIRLMNLEMYLGNLSEKLPSSAIEMEPFIEKDEVIGISFKVSIEQKDFTFTPDTPDAKSGYISYSGKISFDLNSSNTFYCVFPEPCLKPKFSIRFDKSIQISTVERVTCLSIPSNEDPNLTYSDDDSTPFNPGYHWIDEKQRMMLDVDNNIFVLPRSGVYFTW